MFARRGSDTHSELQLFASRCERKGWKNESKREKKEKDTTRLVGEHHPDLFSAQLRFLSWGLDVVETRARTGLITT